MIQFLKHDSDTMAQVQNMTDKINEIIEVINKLTPASQDKE